MCMLCARECPDWCIYIDSHKETASAGSHPAAATRSRNVLDRFAIDFALCMYCGICIEVCPFDALFWSPEFEYAEIAHPRPHPRTRTNLGEWTVDCSPARRSSAPDLAAEEPKKSPPPARRPRRPLLPPPPPRRPRPSPIPRPFRRRQEDQEKGDVRTRRRRPSHGFPSPTGVEITFLLVGLVTLGAAVITVTTRQLVHAALWLGGPRAAWPSSTCCSPPSSSPGCRSSSTSVPSSSSSCSG